MGTSRNSPIGTLHADWPSLLSRAMIELAFTPDGQSSVPVYRQLADILRKLMDGDRLGPGEHTSAV